uniref:Uncharacterized protein n=1 Tax=Lepeophtheirus salmonis TaxID=72036 RepID=A0A0K2TF08_LEPSM
MVKNFLSELLELLARHQRCVQTGVVSIKSCCLLFTSTGGFFSINSVKWLSWRISSLIPPYLSHDNSQKKNYRV